MDIKTKKSIHYSLLGKISLKIVNHVNFLLILLTLIGFTFKLFQFSNISLDSDSAQFGLMNYSIMHGNFLLDGYNILTGNKGFVELWIFHLIPQMLSNLNPLFFKLSLFSTFVATTCIFFLIIYHVTDNIRNSLIFTALWTNIDSFVFSSFTISHMATIFFTGIVLLLLIYIIRKSETDVSKYKILIPIFGICLLCGVLVYSDAYLIFCLTIPITIAYIFGYNNKNTTTNILFSLIFMLSFISFQFGDIILSFFPSSVHIIPTASLYIHHWVNFWPNFLLFIKGTVYFLNNSVYQIWEIINIRNIVVCLIYFSTIIAAIYYLRRDFKDRFIKQYLYITLFTFFAFYTFTSMCIDFSTTRYLLYPALILIVILSLASSSKSHILNVLITIILILNICGNVGSFQKFNGNNNQEELDLIDFLHKENLQFGYGDYWDSNIITYLSKFDVVVRPMLIRNNSLSYYNWNNNDNWYYHPEGAKIFFVTRENNPYIDDQKIQPYLKNDPPNQTFKSGNYSIYVW